jgi:L-ribulose-5-phosphate 3-epimerase
MTALEDVRMIWDRLGIITDEVSANVSEALDWIAERGLRHVEIRTVNGRNVMEMTNEEIDNLRERIEQRGLYVSAIASPVFKCALDRARAVASGDTFGQKEEDVTAHFAKLDRAFEIAGRLNTKRIRIFSFWRDLSPEAVKEEVVRLLKQAADRAEKVNMQLLLENEPSCNGGYASEVGSMVKAVQSPALQALWDPGNEQYGGRTAFPDGYEQVKGLAAHVHLKDARIGSDGKSHCVPIGSGDVPYVKHIQALLADGYEGLFTIETHYIPEGGTAMEGSTMTLNGLRGLLQSDSDI